MEAETQIRVLKWESEVEKKRNLENAMVMNVMLALGVLVLLVEMAVMVVKEVIMEKVCGVPEIEVTEVMES